jgi:small-conductance mechanosensitive channel
MQRYLLKKVKTKKQVSNVKVFLALLKFIFVFFLVVILISLFYGDLTQIGFVAGLLSVALGWALQRPISGVVAWLILVTRRPFDIGDRIIISDMKGDVTNISLTHIFLDEVGGTIEGEERSGRTVMIPTSIIFEKDIINYTHEDDYILVEIVTSITYESNLQKAEEIITSAVKKIMEPFYQDFPQRIPKTSHIRLQFRDSGIDVTVRYYTIAMRRNEIATNIRREIFHEIKRTEDVEFAYPHTEVIFREKNTLKETQDSN